MMIKKTIKKAVAAMAFTAVLVTGLGVNPTKAEAATFGIGKSYKVDTGYSVRKQNNTASGKLQITSGVIPGSLHVDAYLVYKNANDNFVRSTDTMYFPANQSQTKNYYNGCIKNGSRYSAYFRINASSRFDGGNVTYTITP